MLTTRIIILGTGTGVGKTWVTRVLARALRREGASVAALKPIETGVSGGETDAAVLSRESSHAPAPPPFAFPDAVSPHLAARRVGQRVDLERVVEYVAHHEMAVTSHVTSFVLVESAGGCLSPLAPGLTNRDLAVALEPAVWLLVAPDALGVLHDVTATLGALAALRRMPDYVVLSAAREPDASTGSNATELAALRIATPVAAAGRGDERSLDALAAALIASASPPARL